MLSAGSRDPSMAAAMGLVDPRPPSACGEDWRDMIWSAQWSGVANPHSGVFSTVTSKPAPRLREAMVSWAERSVVGVAKPFAHGGYDGEFTERTVAADRTEWRGSVGSQQGAYRSDAVERSPPAESLRRAAFCFSPRGWSLQTTGCRTRTSTCTARIEGRESGGVGPPRPNRVKVRLVQSEAWRAAWITAFLSAPGATPWVSTFSAQRMR